MPLIQYDRLLGTREPRIPVSPERLRARALEIRSSVDVDRLRQLVADLPGPRSRLHAPEAMSSAEALLERELRACGWSFERQDFHLSDEPGQLDLPGPRTLVTYPELDGANVVGIREGREAEVVVLVAHLDTVRDAPGADDNASGMAVALEVARLLPADLGRTAVIAFPDFEEIGLIGSRVLAERLVAERDVRAAIVLDTVGYRSREPRSQRAPRAMGLLYPGQARRMAERSYRGDFVAVLYRRSSRPLARAWAQALAAVTGTDDATMLRDPSDLSVVGAAFSRIPLTRNFSRSDHRRFWEVGVPAIMLSDTGDFRNPHYHRASDVPDTLDYEALADVCAATLLVLRALLAGPRARPGTG